MAETDEEGRITRAYGFNPHTQQARTNEEDEDAQEGSLWSTDPIWQAELNGKTSLKEASYHYLVTDHLGTPVLALNKAGEATWKARYEAFGKTRIDNASTAQINLRLPGQYFDAETGLHQNWNRDYNASIGRYIQADPIGLAGGLNRYVYANGNPINFVDHNGLWSMTICVFNYIGTQITFGKNPNGSGFMSFQFGFGSGGSFAYNPLGRQMGYRECQGNSWGIELGVYAQAAFRFGPIGASTVGARGRTFTATDSNEYKILFKPVVTLRDKIGGIMATSSFGGQITIFGGGEGSNECFCAF